MARKPLTVKRVEEYKCDDGKEQSFLWDSNCPWLALRATPTGNKAFVFQSRLHGTPLRITIGKPTAWTIPDARAEAAKLQRLIDQGIDPRKVSAQEKEAAKAEAASEASLKIPARQAWTAYLAARKPHWSPVHYQDHLNLSQEGGSPTKIGNKTTKPGPLASLLCKPLADLTSEAVAAWMQKEAKERNTATLNSFRKFKAFINWCTEQPQYRPAVHVDCCTTSTVLDVRPRNKTKLGDCLQKEQLKPWFSHVSSIDNPIISAYLQGLLLTGARRRELDSLKWEDIDFQWKKMTIRDKVEGERTIPLTPYLATLLEALPKLKDNDFVFSSSTAKGGHLVSPTKAHNAALSKAGLPSISLHGLRRSFGTLSEWLDIPTGVVAQIQGHKPSALAEKSYRRREIDLLRMHHEKIEAWMLVEAAITFKENAPA